MSTTRKENQSLSVRALWFMAAKTLAFVLNFALPLILVRRLSQQEFGLYKQVFLIVGTAVSVLPLGFGMSAFYFLPRQGVNKAQIVLNVVLFYVFVGGAALIVLILHPQSLAGIFNSPDLIAYAPTVGIAILLWTLSSFLENVVIANQETRLASVLIVAAQTTKTVLLIGAVFFSASLSAIIYAAIIQGALQSVVLFMYLKNRFWRGPISFSPGSLRTQLSYAIPFGIAGLFLRAYADLDSYFVSYKFGPALFAIYALGCFELPLVEILGYSIGSVTIPRVSYLQSIGNTREIIELVARMSRKLAAIYFPVYVLLMICAHDLIRFLFTDRYIGSYPIFIINLTMIPMSLLASAYDPVIRAYQGERYFLVRLRALLTVVLVAALWAGTKYLGLIGAIVAVVAINVAERMAVSARAGRILGVTRSDWGLVRDLGKIGVAAIIAGVITIIPRFGLAGVGLFYALAVSGIVYSLSYVAALFLLDVPTPEEKGLLRRSVLLCWLALMRRQPDAA
ncbi:MAG TPA: oligosaccharide flippase family protein [Blastocatellia bacterium]|nr:oligosaccharide flippase family protein [Blastocatellia bacterium]